MNRICYWTLDPDPGFVVWETDCGEAFVFETGGPKENKMKFCCYCGAKLLVGDPKKIACAALVGQGE